MLAILPDTNEEVRGGRDIVVYVFRRGLVQISATHPSFGPLAFPVLNPTEVSGWHGDIDVCAQWSSDRHSGEQVHQLRRDEGGDQPTTRGGRATGCMRRTVSQRELFAYHTADRSRQRGSSINGSDLHLTSMYHGGDRSFQQYMVDAAAQMEDMKLSHQCQHQS